MSALADLVLWLLVVLAHPATDVAEPIPAPAVVAEAHDAAIAPPAPPVATPRPHPVTPRPTRPHPAPPRDLETAPAGEPSCAPGEEWQGELRCVAVQRPDELVGRQYG